MLWLHEQFACCVQGTAGDICKTLIVAEGSGEWGLFGGIREKGAGGSVNDPNQALRSHTQGLRNGNE